LVPGLVRAQERVPGLASVPDNDLLSGTLNRYISYFAKLGYTYKDRYSFSASGRVDESNFFGVKANQRWVPLWSAGLGWALSNEAFYSIDWLPYLKIRATYGYNGNTNNNATAFATIQYMSPGGSSLVAAPYARVISPPNPALRWEKIRIATIGADFENREKSLGGSLEYYHKTGLDLISQVSVDPTTGFSSYTGNNASTSGRGVDLVLNSRAGGGDFKWENNFLLSYNTDRVDSYQKKGTVFDYISGAKAPFVGKPLFSVYSYRWGGLDPANVILNSAPCSTNISSRAQWRPITPCPPEPMCGSAPISNRPPRSGSPNGWQKTRRQPIPPSHRASAASQSALVPIKVGVMP